ncbi:hypothetical protein C4D60_Mb03t15620 [Musa balbisiana]|uniref:Uncharacterized protein n=1 Tax=Musa balbisiana TaxID=52838 RepID=A0A4S8JB93_MUSBA|nr:hypothetical protein C4D60_Mb03t15620 [Musa balbisiana]
MAAIVIATVAVGKEEKEGKEGAGCGCGSGRSSCGSGGGCKRKGEKGVAAMIAAMAVATTYAVTMSAKEEEEEGSTVEGAMTMGAAATVVAAAVFGNEKEGMRVRESSCGERKKTGVENEIGRGDEGKVEKGSGCSPSNLWIKIFERQGCDRGGIRAWFEDH